VKDYYAILGLDSDASVQSIKVAYRHLARELHPDYLQKAAPQEREAASARMAEVNEAYGVLSRPESRREYDMSVLEEATGVSVTAAGPVAETEPELVVEAAAAAAAPQPARARPDTQVGAETMRQFLNQVREDLVKKSGVGWTAAPLEGFDWALQAGTWPRKYVIAARGFLLADLGAMTKLVNYASVAVAKLQRPFRANLFLFIVAFQRAGDGQAIAALCGRFAERARGQRAHPLIVLHDVASGQRVLLGRRTGDPKFENVLKVLKLR
jgi:hypothetical protein